MTTFELLTRERSHRARVRYQDGHYTFVVAGPDGFVAGGGADHELPDLNRLVDASHSWIDWERETDTLRKLAVLERERYGEDTQRIMSRVFV